ncbi:MAG: TonB-dependent copper receptor [gamma proteobacterium endosymbiont of Lamellibrachia anaximandri]|nr:TonB-dependent copper receptor [gamma proteobacterium endosymbiont of Lamellibrachia anaximandri]
MKLKTLAVAISSLLAAQPLLAADQPEALSDVVVEGEAQSSPALTVMSLDEPSQGIPADAADLLRSIPGVSGARMGGRGIEPIIRGQSQNRLNILLDGAYIHGGCPNRMDPPTAYSAMESYDSVTVIKGSQTVLYGGGGSGGTVLFERGVPEFDEGDHFKGRVDAGYKSNSGTKEISADLAAGAETGYVRGVVGYKDADNYEDGDGQEVRSAFTTYSGNLTAGYTPDKDTRVELNLEANRERDVFFSGANMDSPESDSDNIRLKFDRQASVGPFTALEANIYKTDVTHLMDNYSLRERTAMTNAKTPTTSDTLGGRASGDLMFGNKVLTLGVDYQKNDRDAERLIAADMMLTTDPTIVQSIMWPGAELAQSGFFAELSMPMNQDDSLKAGIRYDKVDASISRGSEKPQVGMSPTPNDLYARYYSQTSESSDENNLGGFLRYEHAIGNGNLFAGVSRSVRTADASERYIASFMRSPTGAVLDWVGNPELDPETHHQIEAGIEVGGGVWSSGFTAYYNDVSDYILRDRARGQDGILLANGTATIYRNVEARFYGLEWEGSYSISNSLSGRASLAYVNAENTTDSRPIAQIAPLEMTLGADYTISSWDLGGTVRANAEQTRADIIDGSGQDVGETAGWVVLDLYGSYAVAESANVRFGVNNLFDKTYAYHVNRANLDPFSPEAIQVNEPGRELWLKGSVKF